MDFEKEIIKRLKKRNMFGGKHTAFEHLAKGIPKHAVGEARKVANHLIKQGLILTKPTFYGLHVSLNPAKLKEIKEILNR